MTKLLLAATLAAAVALPPAHAEPIHARTCGMTTTTDATGTIDYPYFWGGGLYGGPVYTAVPGTLVCSIQVGGSGQYTDPDWVTASAPGVGVVSLSPLLVSYVAASADAVWLCTSWHDATGDFYYDATIGTWVTDPTVARCALALVVHEPADLAIVTPSEV